MPYLDCLIGISNESHKEEDEDTEALANAMKEFLQVHCISSIAFSLSLSFSFFSDNVLYIPHIQNPNMVESLQSATCQMGDYLEGAHLIQETARLAEREHVGRKGVTGSESTPQAIPLPNH